MAGLKPPAPPAFEAFPTDPSVWQNKEESAILRESGNMKLLISSWSGAASGGPEFLTDFDPVETINQKLLVAGVTPEKLGSPDKLEGLRFEKGFWKAWLETYAYELGPPVGCSVRMQLKDNLDKPIEERVAACAKGLGEDGEAWVDAWAGPLKGATQEGSFEVLMTSKRVSYGNLAGADLRGADLRGAVLEHVGLAGADSAGPICRGRC